MVKRSAKNSAKRASSKAKAVEKRRARWTIEKAVAKAGGSSEGGRYNPPILLEEPPRACFCSSPSSRRSVRSWP